MLVSWYDAMLCCVYIKQNLEAFLADNSVVQSLVQLSTPMFHPRVPPLPYERDGAVQKAPQSDASSPSVSGVGVKRRRSGAVGHLPAHFRRPEAPRALGVTDLSARGRSTLVLHDAMVGA